MELEVMSGSVVHKDELVEEFLTQPIGIIPGSPAPHAPAVGKLSPALKELEDLALRLLELMIPKLLEDAPLLLMAALADFTLETLW